MKESGPHPDRWKIRRKLLSLLEAVACFFLLPGLQQRFPKVAPPIRRRRLLPQRFPHLSQFPSPPSASPCCPRSHTAVAIASATAMPVAGHRMSFRIDPQITIRIPKAGLGVMNVPFFVRRLLHPKYLTESDRV